MFKSTFEVFFNQAKHCGNLFDGLGRISLDCFFER